MSKPFFNSLIYLGVLALAISSFWLVREYGINVPHWDDHAVRVFVEEFSWSNFGAIFDFHNEHRIALTRISALKSTFFFEDLNFKTLMYIGQIGIVGLMINFIYLSAKLKFDKLALLIFALFIFNFSTYENSLWAMAAVQNHWVLFWSVLSLLLLTLNGQSSKANKYQFSFSLLFSLMALLTSGNGVLAGLIGLLILLLRRDKRASIDWFVFHFLIFGFYFWNFQGSSSTSEINFNGLFSNFLALSGSLFYPILGEFGQTNIILVLGGFNLIFGLWVFFMLLKGNDKKQLYSFLALQAFFIGTLFLISLSRSNYEVQVLLSSKYKIYSFLILGSNIFYALGIFKKRQNIFKWKIGILIIAEAIFINNQLYALPSIQEHYQNSIAEVINLKENADGAKVSVYHFPTFDFEDKLSDSLSNIDASKIDSIALAAEHAYFFENQLSEDSENYVWLKGNDNRHLIPIIKDSDYSKNNPKGKADLILYNFPTDIYEVYFLEIIKDKIQLFSTDKIIRIEGVVYIEDRKNW